MAKSEKQGEPVPPLSGAVMRTVQKGKRPIWLTAVLVALAVLVAVVAGGTVRWVQTRHKTPGLQVSPTIQKVQNIQNLAINGDTKKAQQQLTQALNDPKLKSIDKVALLNTQGSLYENQKQYQKALDTFKQVDKLLPTQGSAEAIGRVDEELGDKPAAIAAYKLAITRIDKNNPVADTEKARYESMITSLGGQP